MKGQDEDDAGPCRCDSAEAKERGVFRALQKVYASFYSDDAYLERLRFGVDETQVAMGVLVHHSFPDEEELANGVATLSFDFENGDLQGDLVTQPGAESVTNPTGSATPELVKMSAFGLTVREWSSLVPLGDSVLNWPSDYDRLIELFRAVGSAFRQAYPTKRSACLNFEYKKDIRLGLVIKQVRELPQPDASAKQTAFLIDEPVTCELAQYGSVFANHRLKSRWTLHSRNVPLASTNLAQGIYADCALEYLQDGVLQTLSGPMSSWPNGSVSADGSVNTWTTGAGAAGRAWRLETTLTTTVSGSQPPIVTLTDFPKRFSVTYAIPRPQISWGTVTTATNDSVQLQLAPRPGECGLLNQRILVRTNVLRIETSYHWAKPEGSLLAISWPLLRFIETRITGFTKDPIILTNYYSQSYGAYVHNFIEESLFEPGLEPVCPRRPVRRSKPPTSN